MTLPSNLVLTLQPDGSMAFTADRTADPAGSAAAAQTAAESYTDSKIGGLAPVAVTGSYNDLTNKPAAGGVASVNGQTGAVTLTAAALGALSQADADARYVAKANAIDLPSVEAAVAAMFTGSVSTGITFAYDQVNERINATVTPGIASQTVKNVVTLTAAAYAALSPKSPSTLYVVLG